MLIYDDEHDTSSEASAVCSWKGASADSDSDPDSDSGSGSDSDSGDETGDADGPDTDEEQLEKKGITVSAPRTSIRDAPIVPKVEETEDDLKTHAQ